MSSWTPLCCFVATIHSRSLSIVLRCGSLLLNVIFSFLHERQLYSVAKVCLDQSFLSLCVRCHVTALCMLYKVNSTSNQCLFSKLPTASLKVRHARVAAAASSRV